VEKADLVGCEEGHDQHARDGDAGAQQCAHLFYPRVAHVSFNKGRERALFTLAGFCLRLHAAICLAVRDDFQRHVGRDIQPGRLRAAA
jgi:hypothetical protein